MATLREDLGERLSPPDPTGGRRAVRRYEIRTAKRATPEDLDRLGRAFGRLLSRGVEDIRAVEVSTLRGCVRVGLEMAGSARQVRRDGERLFADAWYDAFGPRSSAHIGVLDGEPAPVAA
jgi:hypothetical protein